MVRSQLFRALAPWLTVGHAVGRRYHRRGAACRRLPCARQERLPSCCPPPESRPEAFWRPAGWRMVIGRGACGRARPRRAEATRRRTHRPFVVTIRVIIFFGGGIFGASPHHWAGASSCLSNRAGRTGRPPAGPRRRPRVGPARPPSSASRPAIGTAGSGFGPAPSAWAARAAIHPLSCRGSLACLYSCSVSRQQRVCSRRAQSSPPRRGW